MYFDRERERERDDALHSGVQRDALLLKLSDTCVCQSLVTQLMLINGSGGKCPVPLPLPILLAIP